ncbi:MAG: hypothetical protein ABIN48_10305 [Ginsengibacter sp.]
MKHFILFVAVILAAIWVITFIMYPADIPVHITLGVAILAAIFGVVKMKRMEGV